MDFGTLKVSWIDGLVVLIVLIGMLRGRKRGLSQEVIDMFKWMLIVVVPAYVYEPWGLLLAEKTVFSLLFSYIAIYIAIAMLIGFGFSMLKKSIGEKLTSSDVFGRAEYYLGMVGGAVRYVCILMFSLALLHSRQFSLAELAAWEKMQEDNFGSIRAPSWSTLQIAVFERSFTGILVRGHLQNFLIKPTAPEVKHVVEAREPARRRERAIDEVMGKK